MKKTLTGPRGYKLILDTGEIYADDPGAGTPAIVSTRSGSYTATYWCAMATGELYAARGDFIFLPADVSLWLDEQEATVNDLLYPG